MQMKLSLKVAVLSALRRHKIQDKDEIHKQCVGCAVPICWQGVSPQHSAAKEAGLARHCRSLQAVQCFTDSD